MTSWPLVKRTLATLRSAEFGFLGVVVYTRVHTPRFWGQASSAGTLFRLFWADRGLRISWLMVGILCPLASKAASAATLTQEYLVRRNVIPAQTKPHHRPLQAFGAMRAQRTTMVNHRDHAPNPTRVGQC